MAEMPEANQIPPYSDLFNPTMAAIRAMGGSATIAEIEIQVIKDLDLSDAAVQELSGNGQTVLYRRLAWARDRLKINGLIDLSSRGVWSFTPKGTTTKTVDPNEVIQVYNENYRNRQQERSVGKPTSVPESDDDLPPDSDSWRAALLETLRNIPPDAFERLCSRLLRESGFVEVEVTGRPGDGGIDGRGVVRLAGLINFSVAFQCKRYSGSVGPGEVNAFRGSVQGEADRGLLLTTGTFTRSARQTATRPGAIPIDLIDGELLLDKLKELGLGVSTRTVVDVDTDWFNAL